MASRLVLLTVLALALPALAGCLQGDTADREGNTPTPSTSGLTFSTPVDVPQSSDVSEPHIGIDSKGRIFLSAPTGLGSSSPLFKSEDGGKTWTRIAPNPTRLGGGDTSIAIGPNDEIHLTDLYAGSSTILVSNDNGATWTVSPIASQVPYNDREWNTIDAEGKAYYLGRTFTPGVAAWVSRSDDGGITWIQQGNPWNHALPGEANQGRQDGPFFTNPKTDDIAVVYSCSTNSVCLSRSSDNGVTWTPVVAAKGTGSISNIFPAAAADRDGNYYITYAERNSDDTQIWMTSSPDGDSWATPTQVTHGEGVRLFPWMTAGDKGRISMTWYDTTARGNNNDATAMKDAKWHVYTAFSTNALSDNPTFRHAQVTPTPIKTGTVSTGGLGGNADRSLGDFFSNTIDPTTGHVHYSYIKSLDGTTTLVHAKQTGGTSLYNR